MLKSRSVYIEKSLVVQGMELMQIVGIKDLDDMEIEVINRISNRYFEKVARGLKNLSGIIIHVKKYNKSGRHQKYSIHVKVSAGKRVFVSTKAQDWYLNTCLHKSFEDILHQLEHEFHLKDQNQKVASVRKIPLS